MLKATRVFAASFLFATSSAFAAPTADLVLLHGKIWTVDKDRPQAQAMAVKEGKVLAFGTDAEIQAYVGKDTKIIDLTGMTAVPGFIEGHGHLLSLGQSLMELDLTKAKDWDDIVALVAAAAKQAKPGAWILGRGWHQEKWSHPPQPNVDGLPLHATLDAVSPNNPVMLEHASGHGIYVNALALKLAGIDRNTQDPAGGEIVRDAKGEPVGMLRDNAMELVGRVYAETLKHRSEAENVAVFKEKVRLATQDAVKKGITTFVDQGEGFAALDELKKIADQGGLPLRLYAQVDTTADDSGLPGAASYAKYGAVEQLKRFLKRHWALGEDDYHFTVGTIGEVLSDGALGTHTAWFLKPYDDLPTSSGVSVTSPQEIRAIAEVAFDQDYQLAVHAIGDRANREVLDVYQAVIGTHRDLDRRWRIEHAQHLDPADIPRFGKLGVIASMQSIHECSDAPYVVKRLGEERAKDGAYVWRTLMDSGAMIVNGTDVPVEDEDPIPNFYCAVTRRSLKDQVPFHPEQAMTREEALKSYTANNAYALFAEEQFGSLSPGMRADVTVLSRDIMSVPEADIPATQVVYTLVGGKVVYRRP